MMVMRMKFLKILLDIAKFFKVLLNANEYCEIQFYSFEKLIKNYSKFLLYYDDLLMCETLML